METWPHVQPFYGEGVVSAVLVDNFIEKEKNSRHLVSFGFGYQWQKKKNKRRKKTQKNGEEGKRIRSRVKYGLCFSFLFYFVDLVCFETAFSDLWRGWEIKRQSSTEKWHIMSTPFFFFFFFSRFGLTRESGSNGPLYLFL